VLPDRESPFHLQTKVVNELIDGRKIKVGLRHREVPHSPLVSEYQLLVGAIALLDHLDRAMRDACIAAHAARSPDWFVHGQLP
jgi:hypothetical protein